MSREEDRRRLETWMCKSLTEKAAKGDKRAWKAAWMLSQEDLGNLRRLRQIAEYYHWCIFSKKAALKIEELERW